MKTVLLISHERSLNKTEIFLNAYKNDNVVIVTDQKYKTSFRPFLSLAKDIIVIRQFDICNIIERVSSADIVISVSENLLPIQSQLESYYGIDNISPFAAQVLSNKQHLDNFCRTIGLQDYIPQSLTPMFHGQLEKFKNKEIFSKPDIGTGSNIFFPGDRDNSPTIEYRRWNNRHHFLKHISDKGIHNKFFELNKTGIHSDRFNYMACRIMFQEYIWSQEPSISPYGYVVNGEVKILFYVKNSKIKYGEVLDPLSNPIQSHSKSEISDIVRERAVWIVMPDEVEHHIKQKSNHFMNTLIKRLGVKNMFFAGPDFHINNDRFVAIDLNPRPGQFINVLDRYNDHTIIENIIHDRPVKINKKVLWGCSVLRPGKVKSVSGLSKLKHLFNQQNHTIESGTVIPEFQNLQSREFQFNLDISGNNEQELFNNYRDANQLLQNCITY